MTELFLTVVNMSIAAGWLVLAVLLLRLLLKPAPKWISVLLWGFVAVKAICPLSIKSPWSLIPSAETIPLNIEMEAAPAIDSGITGVNSIINPVISAAFTPQPLSSANPLQIWLPLLSVLWISGLLVLLLYAAISCWRLHRRVNTAVRYQGNIFQSETISSPFVLGVIRPKIYLPFDLREQDMSHVLAHEQAHISRKDHLWKSLGFILLAVHWFNPLMWLAYGLLCRDIELACDEKVVKTLGNDGKADYLQALVACSVRGPIPAACPLAFGEVGVKKRVKHIMRYQKPALWVILLAAAACVLAACCFLTDPAAEDHRQPIADCCYLLIGADGVTNIEISTPNTSGGCSNADGTPFQKGEQVWLERLGISDLRGVSITALGENGEILYTFSAPENATREELAELVGRDTWLIAPTSLSQTVLGFVTALEDGKVSFDPVEWVSEDSNRAETLGIENTNNGYELYNPEEETETLPIAEDAQYYLQKWIEEKNAIDLVPVSQEEFWAVMENRGSLLCHIEIQAHASSSEPSTAPAIDSDITIRQGQIFAIAECYVP